MADPEILDANAPNPGSIWLASGPGVYRDTARQQQQQLNLKDEHMVDPGKVQNVFYIVATSNWDATSPDLDNNALATMALLGLREIKESVERPLTDLDNGGVTAFRRAQARLTLVLDEIARRKEDVEKEIMDRSRRAAIPPSDHR